MTVLVSGGAGYIGSHTLRELLKQKEQIAVIDNLSTGHRRAVHPDCIFYQGDIRDKALLQTIFQQNPIDAVIHFAACALVGESMTQPLKYFNNNVYGLQTLLESMVEHKVDKLVFSSTCAVYGTSDLLPISEHTPERPESCYGETKLVMEKMMRWVAGAHNIRYVSLRYFNVAGAYPDGSIGEDHRPETHLLPLVLQAASGQRECLNIFGADYPTPDGTCIRDYIHVCDLADAHVKALYYLRHEDNPSATLNLGSGRGCSVREMITAAETITGRTIPTTQSPRRPGDPPQLVAVNDKARKLLNWQPVYNLTDTIKTAWNWHTKNPHGFAD